MPIEWIWFWVSASSTVTWTRGRKMGEHKMTSIRPKIYIWQRCNRRHRERRIKVTRDRMATSIEGRLKKGETTFQWIDVAMNKNVSEIKRSYKRSYRYWETGIAEKTYRSNQPRLSMRYEKSAEKGEPVHQTTWVSKTGHIGDKIAGNLDESMQFAI